ncbi:hypothetical protein ColLi_11458 [Colletotrichum liriopes]|uniref:Uncharacterized protein n=1 Tax=Colletotrichum liriopes TaxID=708192 RepID=A0AA37GXP2_9PEZI|nr:hypothetical protein ColLi_11458 [Colletotrichum liriopes]
MWNERIAVANTRLPVSQVKRRIRVHKAEGEAPEWHRGHDGNRNEDDEDDNPFREIDSFGGFEELFDNGNVGGVGGNQQPGDDMDLE